MPFLVKELNFVKRVSDPKTLQNGTSGRVLIYYNIDVFNSIQTFQM